LAHIGKEISGMPATIHTPSPAAGDTLTVGSDRIRFRLTTCVDRSELIALARANGIEITRTMSEVRR